MRHLDGDRRYCFRSSRTGGLNKGGLSERRSVDRSPGTTRCLSQFGYDDIEGSELGLTKGAYKKDAGYWAIFLGRKRKNLPGEL
jgi:hypothetical protein